MLLLSSATRFLAFVMWFPYSFPHSPKEGGCGPPGERLLFEDRVHVAQKLFDAGANFGTLVSQGVKFLSESFGLGSLGIERVAHGCQFLLGGGLLKTGGLEQFDGAINFF